MKIFDTKELIQNAKNIDLNQKIGYISNIKSLDDIARISKQQLTIITARANSGKSTFLDYYCYKIAKHSNIKTLFISFETDATFHTKLLLKYCNRELLQQYMMFADTTEVNTIEDILQVIQYAKDNLNIDNVVIDPFNYISTDQTSDTNQICKVLKELKQIAIKCNISIILVAHPKKLQADEQITGESINGSIHFRNVADLILVLTTDFETRETTIKVDKLRYNKLQGQINALTILKYSFNGTFEEVNKDDEDLFIIPSVTEKEIKNITTTVKEKINEEIKEEPVINISPATEEKANNNDYDFYDVFLNNNKQTINNKIDLIELMNTKVSYLNSVYDKKPTEITLQEALTTKAEEVIIPSG